MSAIKATLAKFRYDGPRAFARWNAVVFDAVAAGPFQTLADRLGRQPDADATLAGYLRLVQQGVGSGVIKQAGAGGAHSSFLERLLVELIPARLPEIDPKQRLRVLVDA